MRNWYDRKYIVIHAPVAERRGRTFERKLAEAEDRGFVLVGYPNFQYIPVKRGYSNDFDPVLFGTCLMRARGRGDRGGKV